MKSTKKNKNSILELLADQVRIRRHTLSMTQGELAETAGLHVNYIGSIERGERNPSLNTLEDLAKALKCSITDLLTEYKTPTSGN